jgi:hypothetical protein
VNLSNFIAYFPSNTTGLIFYYTKKQRACRKDGKFASALTKGAYDYPAPVVVCQFGRDGEAFWRGVGVDAKWWWGGSYTSGLQSNVQFFGEVAVSIKCAWPEKRKCGLLKKFLMFLD